MSINLELANGGGVLLRDDCALCREPVDLSIVCPICSRQFCHEPCFGVHLIARDALDTKEAIEAFTASDEFRQLIAAAHEEWDESEDDDELEATPDDRGDAQGLDRRDAEAAVGPRGQGDAADDVRHDAHRLRRRVRARRRPDQGSGAR